MSEKKESSKLSTSKATGIIALVFLAIGYQTALFVHKAAVTGIAANRDSPDTVFVLLDSCHLERSLKGEAEKPHSKVEYKAYRKASTHSKVANAVRSSTSKRSYESFHFDPNTASIETLQRLGFSQRQAESIDNYRQKGGRFRRKQDFAKSYVVADSVYRRLEPFIDIPLVDLNSADSAAFDALPGIGPYYAAKMVSYREELGGYSYPEQLMDIYRFDDEKFNALKDLITVSPAKPFPLWTAPEDSLRAHPYIRNRAHGVVLFRDNNPKDKWTVANLQAAGVLSPTDASRLARCNIQD